jgi:hypothetical protein
VIIMWSRIDREPPGWVHNPRTQHPLYKPNLEELLEDEKVTHGVFKEALGSPKHIAEFVDENTPYEMQRIASRCHRVRRLFPQTETFTAISRIGIDPSLWSVFTEEWRRQDMNLPSQVSPIDLLVSQDESLIHSWIILLRRESYHRNRKHWEMTLQYFNKKGRNMTRAEGARIQQSVVKEKAVDRAGSRVDVGEREEKMEWEEMMNYLEVRRGQGFPYVFVMFVR